MSVLTEATDALRTLEEELSRHPQMVGGEVSHRLAKRIREVRRLLSQEEARWIGTTQAKRLLGVEAEDAVKAWAQMGFLRSRTLPNGRLQLLLDDVLRRREETEGLSAFGGEDLTDEELRVLKESRPGKNPWERERADTTQ